MPEFTHPRYVTGPQERAIRHGIHRAASTPPDLAWVRTRPLSTAARAAWTTSRRMPGEYGRLPEARGTLSSAYAP